MRAFWVSRAPGTRKFVAWGSRPRPGSRAPPLSLGRHHKPFGSVRIARGLHGLDLVGASTRPAPLDPRSQRQQGSRLRWAIDTRLASGACSEAPERARLHMGLAQRWPCGPEPGCGRRGGGLRSGVLAPPRHWYPTAMPHALRRATQAPRPRSARAPLDLLQGVAVYHPSTRTYVSHQHATPKPSALGESGWASCVARASQIRTNPLGRRVRHFGARNRISCSRIRWPVGPRRPERHGELGGVLISIPRPLGRALYRSGGGRASFRPPFC